MSFNIVIKEEAYADTLEAYLYYEEQQVGLGDRFLHALKLAYAHIKENPQYNSYLTVAGINMLRDVKVKGFPYVVVYKFEDALITVYSVHNSYKQPRSY